MESLRQRQIASLVRMLHLNADPQSSIADASNQNTAEAPIWKVLIFDSFCRDIVSTVLRVNDLRDNGVTVHMLMEAQRSPIPDVPAIYFARPIPENIKRITDDISRDLYELYYVNFSSSLPRTLLEEFAIQTTASGTSHQVAQIYDQYLDFLCPEENMFSLHFTNTFETIHNPAMSDTAMSALIDKIVSGLFSVLLTLKTVPTICAPRGNAAEMVATRLDAKLREHIMNAKHNLFAETDNVAAQSRRPVLVLLDRDLDLGSMLMHSWTYQALIHDLYDIQLNQVSITQTNDSGQASKKAYDINTNDTFWKNNAMLPFPEVAINIDDASNAFKREADEITRMGGVQSLDEVGNLNMESSTKQLQRAITTLPELTARKANIDMHMNIATSLLDKIKDRQLDVLFQMEDNLARQTKASILEAINDPEKKQEDKLRLFVLYMLAKQGIRQEDIEECESALKAIGCNISPLEYIHRLRSLNQMSASIASPALGSSGGGAGNASHSGDLLGKFSSISNRLAGLTDNSSLGSIFSNVRNLLPTHKQLPVTSIVESAMGGRAHGGGLGAGLRSAATGGGSSSSSAAARMFEDFIHLDPKQARRGNLAGSNANALRGSLASDGATQEAIVFVIGGGNYIEYQNLMEFAQRSTPRKHIVYGSTDIVNASGFLAQLTRLNDNTP